MSKTFRASLLYFGLVGLLVADIIVEDVLIDAYLRGLISTLFVLAIIIYVFSYVMHARFTTHIPGVQCKWIEVMLASLILIVLVVVTHVLDIIAIALEVVLRPAMVEGFNLVAQARAYAYLLIPLTMLSIGSILYSMIIALMLAAKRDTGSSAPWSARPLWYRLPVHIFFVNACVILWGIFLLVMNR